MSAERGGGGGWSLPILKRKGAKCGAEETLGKNAFLSQGMMSEGDQWSKRVCLGCIVIGKEIVQEGGSTSQVATHHGNHGLAESTLET